MGEVVLLSFTAALNPTLLTATTVMLLLDHPARLMLGYWVGAMMTSITLGLLIVFALQGSSAVSTTKHTLSPVADIVLGGIALVLALVLGTERERGYRERRATRKKDKDPPKWRRALSRGTARTTFVIGALLTLPGASYIAGMTKLAKLDYPAAGTVLVVIGFNLVMLILLELPMLAFRVAPEWTPNAIDRVQGWIGLHGRRFAVCGLSLIGAALVARGLIGLL
jgi:Sap, sulfolipid-1-addressing protein